MIKERLTITNHHHEEKHKRQDGDRVKCQQVLKKASGSDSPGSSDKQNGKNESSEKGSYSFQKDDSLDKNKLAPREEL